MGGVSDYVVEGFEVMEHLERAADPNAIIGQLGVWLSQFGYTSFLVTGMPLPQQERLEPYILLNGWPDDWYRRYTNANHYQHDPVARQCFATLEPFAWSELPPERLLPTAASRVMDEAAECGLREGLCVPLHDVHGFQAAVTMAGAKPELPTNARRMVHLLALYAFSAADRIFRSADRGVAVEDQLSAREREILRWTAVGKTSWEIGKILGISEFTVNTHLRNSRRKLGTSNNVHSVVEALRRHEIRL